MKTLRNNSLMTIGHVWASLAMLAWALLPIPVRGEEGLLASTRIGLTAKADWMNVGLRPGLKVLVLDKVALEANYIGIGGDYTGFSLRGTYLFPALWSKGERGLRPYAGAGYTHVEKTVESGGAATYNYGGYQMGYTAKAKYEYEGNGAQIFGGLQINPFSSLPNLFFEAELNYSLFDVEYQASAAVQGTGEISGVRAQGAAKAESDYSQMGLMVGFTYYF